MKSVPPLRVVLALPAMIAAGCVGARDAPLPPAQVSVAYGGKLWLVDETLDDLPDRNVCTRRGAAVSGAGTGTVTIAASDGKSEPIHVSDPHNCYVRVRSGTLHVDSIEVTNELFQLCIDSGHCKEPIPADATKAKLCTTEDRFDTCAVANVPYTEARSFCEFIGRRLPTGIEHVAFRLSDNPQTPSGVPMFSNGKSTPPQNCTDGALKAGGCTRLQPATIDGSAMQGGSSLDRTSKGVFDVLGGTNEWSQDLLPLQRGGLGGANDGLPWFCRAGLTRTTTSGAPLCKDEGGQDTYCVWGQYRPSGTALPVTDYPVCVAYNTLAPTNGVVGSLFGGSFADPDQLVLPQAGSPFLRQRVENPDDGALASYGVRCAGESGKPADDMIRP